MTQDEAAAARERARKRARLDAVFGSVLPQTTGDERDEPGSRASHRSTTDYLRDRPPHHGG